MWDFTKVIWKTSAVMRYDTPGDWHGDVIEAWEGMPLLSQRAVQLHEFNESIILRAAGVTEDMIDVMDDFKNAAFAYSKGEIEQTELALRAVSFFAIPAETRNLYDEAHVIALQVERAFLEAAGVNWQKHCRMIEDTRGKIPHEGQA